MSRGGSSSSAIQPRWALGLCDRCGFSFLLSDLHREIYDLRENGLKVCSVCLDVDQPQLQLGRVDSSDPQALFDPRPDIGRFGSIGLFGWLPCGNPLSSNVQCVAGMVTIA